MTTIPLNSDIDAQNTSKIINVPTPSAGGDAVNKTYADGTGVVTFNTRAGAVAPTSGDYAVAQVTGAAPLASPTFTGTPAAPTPTTGDNSTKIATTAFVQATSGGGGTGAVTAIGTHASRLAATPSSEELWAETDTGLVYRYNGATWDIWNAEGLVPKIADETVNNSAVLQNDNDLKFPIEVNEMWWFQLILIATGVSTTADLKFGFSVPSGLTMSWWGASFGQGVLTTASPTVASGAAATSAFGLANNQSVSQVIGLITNGSTAGTWQFQWAQNTATAENVILNKGSLLKLHRLA